MLKKTIVFEDLDGNEVSDVFYFNLSEAELAELELTHNGGFGEYLQKIVDDEDGKGIVDNIKKIIELAHGRKAADNRRFEKSAEINAEFMQTDAYSKLFMELATDAVKAAEFISGCVPQKLSVSLNEEIAKNPEALGLPVAPEVVEKPKRPQDMTHEELVRAMQERNKA